MNCDHFLKPCTGFPKSSFLSTSISRHPTFHLTLHKKIFLSLSKSQSSIQQKLPIRPIKMEKLPLTQVSPSHSHSSCASSRNGAQGYLYDDYAREIPCFPKPTCYQTKRTAEYTPKMQSSLYIVAWLAVIVFLIQLGASLSDVPSTRLLEDIVCHKYYHNNSNTLIPENQCTLDTVQGELNVVLTGALILGYLPGEVCSMGPENLQSEKRVKAS